MQTYNVTNARANLYALLNEVNQNHTPIQIVGKNGNGILISEEDWRSIEETLYLSSIPGMVESILEGSKEPLEDCIPEEEVEW